MMYAAHFASSRKAYMAIYDYKLLKIIFRNNIGHSPLERYPNNLDMKSTAKVMGPILSGRRYSEMKPPIEYTKQIESDSMSLTVRMLRSGNPKYIDLTRELRPLA